MLIGAYRDNEVDPGPSANAQARSDRGQAGGKSQEIALSPLAREDLGQLVADALHCEPERVTPLAQLVHEKTAGNPFFAIQFLSSLADEGLLTFDHDERAMVLGHRIAFTPRVTPTTWLTLWSGS